MKLSMPRTVLWRPLSFLLDCAVAAIAFLAAYGIVFRIEFVPSVPGIAEKTLMFTAICAVSFILFATHRGSWRFVSLPEMMNLGKATVLAVVVYTAGAFLISRGSNVPRSVLILTSFLMFAGLAGPRIMYRLAVEGGFLRRGIRKHAAGTRYVLILGYTSEADAFIRATRRSPVNQFDVVGILDDRITSQSMQGVRVYGRLDEIDAVVARLKRQRVHVSELVVAESRPDRQRLIEIVDRATAAGLRTTRIPDQMEMSHVGPTGVLEPRPIEIRELLGRTEIVTDVSSVADLIRGKVVLVTGAGGSIGSELVRQIAQFDPSRLVLTDNSEHNTYLLDTEIRDSFPHLDIVTQLVSVRDALRLDAVFATHRPQIVFHAAALKHVPIVEDNPIEGIKTNVIGTRNAADAALKHGTAIFVMISTDKAVNPTNIMGASKRAAEAYCQAIDVTSATTRFKTVRFGNVLGSNGSVVPRFQEQILTGGPVTVTHPQIVRYFMTIPEAVRLVLHATAKTLGTGPERGTITVLDMGKPVRILDLAERMIQLAGLRPGIDIQIAFIGPRQGEKLYEELFDPSELKDSHLDDGYVIALPRIIDGNLMKRTLDNLQKAAEAEDAGRVIDLLRHIVPEYQPAPPSQQAHLDDADIDRALAPVRPAE